MANTIFFGDRVRALRAALQLNTAATIASGAVDPTSVAPGISLSVGSIYLSTSTGKIYTKHTSTGDDTNFYEVQTSDTIAALAADVADLVSLTGVAVNSTDLGTFTGTTIPDNSDIKEALQALETEVETKLDASEKGASLGVATLDAGGKVPVSQLPNSLMDYLGTWAASTNTPTLANGTGNAGDVYVASDAGTVDFGAGNITFAAGDWVIYSGSVWQKSVNSNAVASVNGFTGVVVLDTDDVAEGAGNLYFTEPRVLATDLLGFVSGSGNVTAADSILTAVQKLNGNTAEAFGDINDLITLSGVPSGTNLGTFTGTTIPDNSTIKVALQSLETAVEVAPSTVFSDSVFRIQDNGDATKQVAFEASAITTATTRTITMPDTNVNLGDIAAHAIDIADLVTLSGVAANSTDLGTFTGITIPDNSDIKEALQALETAVETSGGGATTELDNLTTTAINADLLPDTTSTYTLGSTSLKWNEIYANNGRFVNDVLVTAPDVLSTPQVSLVDSDLNHLNMTLQSSTESGLIDLSGSGTLDIQSSTGNIKLTPGSGLIDVSSAKITELADPTNPQDAATKIYSDNGTTQSTDDLTLVAADTITTSITHTHQVIIVAGNAAGTVVLSATPFGTGTAKDGQLITLIGNSATNLIQIDNNNAAKGCIMNASWVGGLYDSITFAYSSIQDRYVEISRNN